MSAKQKLPSSPITSPLHIGWREWVILPGLQIPAIKAKIDTGARTSALHTSNIRSFQQQGALWVEFTLHPLQKNTSVELLCRAEVSDIRKIRDSGGHVEERFIIMTELCLGNVSTYIELSLTNRERMTFRLLLGRTALQANCIIHPTTSFLLGKQIRRAAYQKLI